MIIAHKPFRYVSHEWVKEYPFIHHFGIPMHTQSVKVSLSRLYRSISLLRHIYMALAVYFWNFHSKIIVRILSSCLVGNRSTFTLTGKSDKTDCMRLLIK